MRTSLLGSLLLLGQMAPAAQAQSATATYLFLQPESRLWVEGTSTVRSFTCQAPGVVATVEAASPGAAAAVLAGEKAIRTVDIRVPASQMDCSNGTMNSHMQKALESAENPTIRFQLSGYELGGRGAEGIPVTMSGKLTLGGVERPIAMRATAVEGSGGTLKIVGSQPVKMSDHGLKPPSLMMGTMKVGDQVTVRYELTLKP